MRHFCQPSSPKIPQVLVITRLSVLPTIEPRWRDGSSSSWRRFANKWNNTRHERCGARCFAADMYSTPHDAAFLRSLRTKPDHETTTTAVWTRARRPRPRSRTMSTRNKESIDEAVACSCSLLWRVESPLYAQVRAQQALQAADLAN